MNDKKSLIIALLLGYLSAAHTSSASDTPGSRDLGVSPLKPEVNARARSCKKDIINGIAVKLCQGDRFPHEQTNNLLMLVRECFEAELGAEFFSLPTSREFLIQNLQAIGPKIIRFWVEGADDSKMLAFLTVDNFEGFKDKWDGEISLQRTPRIRQVCVTKDYRGKKLGQAIFDFTLRSLPGSFHPLNHSIFLTVFANNTSAIHIYNKCGFKVISKMSELCFDPPHYRTSRQEPFLLMWHKPTSEPDRRLNDGSHIRGAL